MPVRLPEYHDQGRNVKQSHQTQPKADVVAIASAQLEVVTRQPKPVQNHQGALSSQELGKKKIGCDGET